MASGPIALLSEKDLGFIPEPPIFAALAAQELGDHGTNRDGFDSLLNDTASLLASSQAVVDSIGADLAEASDALAAPDSDSGAQMVTDLQSAADAADAQLNDFGIGVGIAPNNPPATGGGDSGPESDCTRDATEADADAACGSAPNPNNFMEMDENGTRFFNRDAFGVALDAYNACRNEVLASKIPC